MLVISIVVFCPFFSTREDLMFYICRSKSFVLLSFITVDPSLGNMPLYWYWFYCD